VFGDRLPRFPRLAAVLLAGLGAVLLALPGGSLGGGAGRAVTPTLVARFGWTGGTAFGTSVALLRNGKTAVIGEPTSNGGTAWVFTEHSSQTDQWSKFRLPGENKAGFGTSVAISSDGKVVLVGAPYDNRRKKGTAWVYRKTGGGDWIGHKLRPKDEKGQSTFGYSVALSANGSTALVGGFADNKQKGAAWVFARSGSTWKQQGKKLTGEGERGPGSFGRAWPCPETVS
jgi:hypothetical protein